MVNHLVPNLPRYRENMYVSFQVDEDIQDISDTEMDTGDVIPLNIPKSKQDRVSYIIQY